MSNYPPGVTGNEPHLTGEWPCIGCGGSGGDRYEAEVCPHCKGSGIEPEEFDVEYVESLADSTDKALIESTLIGIRCLVLDREIPDERRYLKAAARLNRQRREIS